MANRSSGRQWILLASLYIIGFAIGMALWNAVALPYRNPWGVVGLPAIQKFNPANNIIRFLILIACPTLLLVLVYLAAPKRIAGPAHEDHVEPKSPVQPQRLFAVLLVCLAVLAALNIPTYHAWGEMNRFHEGESLGTSISHLYGKVPYEDYLFVHGVYQDPLRSVIAFRLFGRSISAARTLESLTKIAAFLLLALLLIEWFRPDLATAYWALLFVVALHGLVQLEAMWLPLAPLRLMPRDATAMAFLLALLRLFRASRPQQVVLPAYMVGFIPLASFGHSIDRGFYLTGAAFVAWMILLRPAARRWFWISTCAGVLSAVVVVGYLLQWRFKAFLTFTFWIMPRYKELMDGIAYPIDKAPMWGIAALAAANVYWLAVHFLKMPSRRFIEKFFFEVCLLFLSVFFFRSALGRADIVHVSVNSWPIYLLAFALFSRSWLSRYQPLLRKGAAVAAVILALVCCYRLYGSPIARENFPLRRTDAMYLPSSYLTAAQFLRENLKPEESFFTMTSEALWYYLVDRPCPARFPVVWFAAPYFYQEEIIRDLETRKVKFILYKNDAPSNQIDGISNEIRLPLVTQYIRLAYAPFRNIEGHEIWIRN